jgi:4-hydroxy-4-methyl-2-oxoglutarate aldolase
VNESWPMGRSFDVSCLSDALDRVGIPGQVDRVIMPISRGARCAGRAFTVRYEPIGSDGGTVGDFVDEIPEGSVVVVANSGRLDCTVWGDILTDAASYRRLAGTVIDGLCRDVNRILELEYPVFARNNWMRTGKGRVRLEEVGGIVDFGGVRVASGDLVFGDADGIVVVPAGREQAVLEAAEEIEVAEKKIRDALARGVELRIAREEFGYHRLQQPRGAQNEEA